MKVLLLAGEESGVLYAERLRRALPGCEFRTYQDHYKTSDLAVMGFWAVIKRLFFFLGVQRTMKRVIREWRPDVVVTIDYPGLNLKLAVYAKARGVPVVHIVCPQVWAWHQGRIPKVAAAVNRLLCFFPFEPALFKDYESKEFHALFIGHPMVDIFKDEMQENRDDGANGSGRVLAILPGSRVGEIQRNLPRLLDAVRLLDRRDLRVVIPAANDRAEKEIIATIAARDDPLAPEVVKGGARDLLRRADCAAVASGTATLEAALARCPTVLVYAVSALFAWFARRVITGVKHIGLANVIAEKSGVEPPMPELLQEAFTPEAVAAQLAAWLDDAEARARASRALDDVMARLHSDGDALGLAARAVREIATCHTPRNLVN
jgi:lipid-A-disaccharide synthase